jgi:hypothetical protein
VPINKIATDIGSVVAAPVFSPPSTGGNRVALLQVGSTGTATIDFEGRLDPSLPWVSLLEVPFTGSGMVSVVLPPEVRINVTAWTSGSVNAWLLE